MQRAVRILDMPVVLVRRVAAPIAARGVNLDQHQPMDRRTRRQQVVDLAADVVPSANAPAHRSGRISHGA